MPSDCRDFDANLKKYGHEYNATLYILPTALVKSPQNAALVRNVWCGPNPGQVWRDLMSNPEAKPIAASDAGCDPKRSMETSDDIAAMLRLRGTPGFILGNVNGKAAITGFPPNAKPASQKQMLDAIMGKQ